MATAEEIQKICKGFKGATESIKWENHLCFCVAEKMFLVLGVDNHPVSASFKVSDEEFDELSSRPGLIPAPYLARYKWVLAEDISTLTLKEWQYYIDRSYTMVVSKLPKRVREGL